jgi:hypothetical protein
MSPLPDLKKDLDPLLGSHLAPLPDNGLVGFCAAMENANGFLHSSQSTARPAP